MTERANNSIFRFALMEAIETLLLKEPEGATGQHIFQYFELCKQENKLPIPDRWTDKVFILGTLREMTGQQIEISGVDVDLSKRGSPLKRFKLTERGKQELQETEAIMIKLMSSLALARGLARGKTV